MIKYLVAALILTLALAQTSAEWEAYKDKFHKHYATPEEEAQRYAYWEADYKFVQTQNAMGHNHVSAQNSMSDFSPEEKGSKD